MPDSFKNPFISEELLSAWMKTSGSFFEAMAGLWSFRPGTEGSAGGFDRFAEIWASGLQAWAASPSSMEGTGAMEAAIRSMESLPELSFHLLQTGMNGFSLLQQRWADRLAKLNESSRPYDFTDLDKEFLNRWTEAYKKEFRQYLKIPQLGIARFYQERLNDAMDRYNMLQAALTEFVHLFSVPVEKSLQVMNQKLAEMAEDGTIPEDFRDVYRMWIKTLEGHYMTLFQSPEYADAMAKTVDAMNEFVHARQKVVESVLKSVPLPSQTEMDELYKEMYRLKKRIWELEKQRKVEKA